jgi:hypothetical protein
MRFDRVSFLIGWICLAALPLPSAAQQADEPVAYGPTSTFVWLGADKKPLPFRSAEELLIFLQTAEEVSSKPLSVGITKAKRIHLAKGGIEARAVFHDIDRNEQEVKRLANDNVVMYLRDSYLNQTAAYEMSRMLGMKNVPPTVLRQSAGDQGSAQLWIENAMTEQMRVEQDLEPPDYTLWNQYYADMRIFDNLINNIDRNQGNMLVDSSWNLWLIDHTRSFGRDKALPYPEAVTRCSRTLWEGIQSKWDDAAVEKRMAPYMKPKEVEALLSRRQKLVALIEKKIAEQGEKMVLFNFGDPDPAVKVSSGSASAHSKKGATPNRGGSYWIQC